LVAPGRGGGGGRGDGGAPRGRGRGALAGATGSAAIGQGPALAAQLQGLVAAAGDGGATDPIDADGVVRFDVDDGGGTLTAAEQPGHAGYGAAAFNREPLSSGGGEQFAVSLSAAVASAVASALLQAQSADKSTRGAQQRQLRAVAGDLPAGERERAPMVADERGVQYSTYNHHGMLSVAARAEASVRAQVAALSSGKPAVESSKGVAAFDTLAELVSFGANLLGAMSHCTPEAREAAIAHVDQLAALLEAGMPFASIAEYDRGVRAVMEAVLLGHGRALLFSAVNCHEHAGLFRDVLAKLADRQHDLRSARAVQSVARDRAALQLPLSGSSAAGGWRAHPMQPQPLMSAAPTLLQPPPPPPPLPLQLALVPHNGGLQQFAPLPSPLVLAGPVDPIMRVELGDACSAEPPHDRLIDAVDWPKANLCRRHQITGRCNDEQCAVLRSVVDPFKRQSALARIHQSSACALCGPLAGHVLGSHAAASWREKFGLPALHQGPAARARDLPARAGPPACAADMTVRAAPALDVDVLAVPIAVGLEFDGPPISVAEIARRSGVVRTRRRQTCSRRGCSSGALASLELSSFTRARTYRRCCATGPTWGTAAAGGLGSCPTTRPRGGTQPASTHT
jgi:hypothetical protein